MVTGSAVTVSGPALTVNIGMFDNENQTIDFQPTEDGGITGTYQLKLHRGSQILKVDLNTEKVESNAEVEYIWKRDGATETLEYDMIDLGALEDLDENNCKIITYSITIKPKAN